MWGNRFHSTPCRFPGNLKTRSRRPWCRSPCHRGSCSHRPCRRHNSSSSKLQRCRRRTRPGPPPCCRGPGTRRRGTRGCSERSNLSGSQGQSGCQEVTGDTSITQKNNMWFILKYVSIKNRISRFSNSFVENRWEVSVTSMLKVETQQVWLKGDS